MIEINKETQKIKIHWKKYDYTAFSLNTTFIFIYNKGQKLKFDYDIFWDVYINGELMTDNCILQWKYFKSLFKLKKHQTKWLLVENAQK